jgi:hypothetical protein
MILKVAIFNSHRVSHIAVLAIIAGAAFLGARGTDTYAEASQTSDARVLGETLRVKGTQHEDALTLRLRAGDSSVLEVDVGDDGTAEFAFSRSAVAAINVNARGGDDRVRIDETNGPIVEATQIRGGPGDDTILGGAAVETIYGGPGDDFIDGNRANDVAFMGAGNDTFRWDPGDASDVVEGDDGFDEMLFNGANGGETVEVSANGERVTFFRQPGTITMDLNDIEVSAFNALGGTDTITVNDLTGTDAAKVDLNLDSGLGSGAGDGIADLVTVNGTAGDDGIVVAGSAGEVNVTGLSAAVAISSPEFANDRLNINTLAGNDAVDASGLAAGVIQVIVN